MPAAVPASKSELRISPWAPVVRMSTSRSMVLTAKPDVVASDRQELDLVELSPQRQHLSVAMRDLEPVSGLQELQRSAGVGQRDHRREIRKAQAVAAEQDLEGVAALHEQVEGHARQLGRRCGRELGYGGFRRELDGNRRLRGRDDDRGRGGLDRDFCAADRRRLTRCCEQDQGRDDEREAETYDEQRPASARGRNDHGVFVVVADATGLPFHPTPAREPVGTVTVSISSGKGDLARYGSKSGRCAPIPPQTFFDRGLYPNSHRL